MSTNLDNDKLNEQKEETAGGGLYGWICPVCGRGLSPYTSSCPCAINREITCGTGTAVPQFGTVVSHNAPTANLREDADPGRWYAVGYKSNEGEIISHISQTGNCGETYSNSRCNKCVNEYRCSKTMDKEGKCPIYKRDPKDGGFYG